MTLAKRRNVVNIFLICFYEMFYRNFSSLKDFFKKSFMIIIQWNVNMGPMLLIQLGPLNFNSIENESSRLL